MQGDVGELIIQAESVGRARDPLERRRYWEEWRNHVKSAVPGYRAMGLKLTLSSFAADYRLLAQDRQMKTGTAPGRLRRRPAGSLRPRRRDKRAVFVVFGRDSELKNDMFSFLRAIDARPLEWSDGVRLTGKPTPYVSEVLDAAFAHAQAVIVILSPDDEARLGAPFRGDAASDKRLTPQPRINVIFEAGMAFGRHPSRSILVEVGKMRAFTDIQGLHTIRPCANTAWRKDLVERLRTAGCKVDDSNGAFLSAGRFEPAGIPRPA